MNKRLRTLARFRSSRCWKLPIQVRTAVTVCHDTYRGGREPGPGRHRPGWPAGRIRRRLAPAPGSGWPLMAARSRGDDPHDGLATRLPRRRPKTGTRAFLPPKRARAWPVDASSRRLQRSPWLGGNRLDPGRRSPTTASPMSITIAGTTFEHHHYDRRGDVLYLSVAHYAGPPARASSTPEGHNIEYDAEGRVIGMTLTNVSWLLDREWRARYHASCRAREPRRSRRSSPASRIDELGPPLPLLLRSPARGRSLVPWGFVQMAIRCAADGE